jgi:polynucleotide 5'-hydroxyl-kinase GRC3/NOL9
VSETAAPDVPADWAEAIQDILSGGVQRVVVLGPPDAGKSSFCRALLCEAIRIEQAVVLIDADVGQKTVGPPAAVTLAHADRSRTLAGLAFVGTTDPVRGLSRIVAGTRRLLLEAGVSPVIVNTGGLLAGAGRRLKAAKLAAVRPELIVTLGADPNLDTILDRHPVFPVIRLASSPQARRKTSAHRRRAREEAFRRYFQNASVWHLDASGIQGADIPERLLVGFADDSGRDLAMGILLGLQREQHRLDLFGPDLVGTAISVIPGMLRLDENFRDFPANEALLRNLPP